VRGASSDRALRPMSLKLHINLKLPRIATNSLECERARAGVELCRRLEDSYLVDPASSHMLVSKIKPCMSKCK
jgi:hypothetical protein